MSKLGKSLPPLIILALVATFAITMFFSGDGTKTVTAYFPRAVSVYEGSDVRVLGVAVGTIDKVVPEGTQVKVTITYRDDVDIPINAKALVVSPSIVGDRYVQLEPAYVDGKKLADDAVLKTDRTAIPLELDEIYANLDELTVALGPEGANAEGALSDLLNNTAANFSGQGAKLNQTLQDFSTLTTTLDNNKEELFGSAEALGGFIKTLADNDSTVRSFNQSLSDVSDLLAGEREELSGALANLAIALDEVGTFVQDNRQALGTNIRGLNRVAKVLVKRRGELDEILRTAPVALNNLVLAYNPDAGTLDTNANLGNLGQEILSDPIGLLCSVVASNDPNGTICDLLSALKPPTVARTGPFASSGNRGSATTRPSNAAPFDPTLNGLVAP